jgi:hypothetical protein
MGLMVCVSSCAGVERDLYLCDWNVIAYHVMSQSGLGWSNSRLVGEYTGFGIQAKGSEEDNKHNYSKTISKGQ